MTAAAKRQMTLSTPSDLEITLNRAFDAPRALVFKAITTPDYVRRWWGAGAMPGSEICSNAICVIVCGPRSPSNPC